MSDQRDWNAERTLIEVHAGINRIALIADSFFTLTGDRLVSPGNSVADTLWHMPAALVAHGTEPDPVFFYANRAALELFEFPAAEFVRLPSRFSAAAPAREERARLLSEVSAKGYINHYSGVRTARSGRGFRIERATIWNLIVDPKGSSSGQAACFDTWAPL